METRRKFEIHGSKLTGAPLFADTVNKFKAGHRLLPIGIASNIEIQIFGLTGKRRVKH